MSEQLVKAALAVLKNYDDACSERFDELAWSALNDSLFQDLRVALASKPVPAVDVESLVKDIHDAIAELAGVARYPDLTDAIDRLAALAAQPVREPMWQPIETAPKDGTLVLLCCVGWPHSVLRGEPWPMKVGGWWETRWDIFGASWEPTHWMPLPAAPGITKE